MFGFKRWRVIETRNPNHLNASLAYFKVTGLRGYAIVEPPITLKEGCTYSDLKKLNAFIPNPYIKIFIKSTKKDWEFLEYKLLGLGSDRPLCYFPYL